jgi:TfoX N-terminal domain
MAYNEKLAARIRKALGPRKGLVAKQMFGGIAFLLNGNMCVGIHKDELIVRLAPDETDAALAKPHTRVFDLTGRPMKGWILVAPKGIATDAQLAKWIAIAATYAGALPAKK